MVICRERLGRLLRYGRKNDGAWDDCDCEDGACFLPDDGDVEALADGYEQLDAIKLELGTNKGLLQKTEEVVSGYAAGITALRSRIISMEAERDTALAENKELRENAAKPGYPYQSLKGQLSAAKAEVERLRGVMQWISTAPVAERSIAGEMKRKAQEALNPITAIEG